MTVPLESGERLTATGVGETLRLEISVPHLWTPDDPYLYTMTISTATDKVESYFALRTVSTEGRNGHTRLCLNEEAVFLHGVLDQGYFQDCLFLPKEPEEYERDILRMKELRFNTLCKHIKVEPEAFYYACDRLGMLVVQDMVNSGDYHYIRDTVIPTFILRAACWRGTGRENFCFSANAEDFPAEWRATSPKNGKITAMASRPGRSRN